MNPPDLSFSEYLKHPDPARCKVRERLYKLGQAGMTDRFQALDRYDAHYQCREYDHQIHDWTGRSADALETISPQAILPYGFTQPAVQDLAVRQKRPTAPRRMSRMVINRFTGYLFSESRLPDVRIEGDHDADAFIRAVFKRSRFWRAMHIARGYGGAMGSALVVTRLVQGVFRYKAISPKCVQEIVWEDQDEKIPAAVLIQYPFSQTEVSEETGRLVQVPYLYRRIIDADVDLTFQPVPLDGRALPRMEVDPDKSIVHGLGEFPGTWIQNVPNDEGIDGYADCEGAYQMMDDGDRQVAQQGFALNANMDPTLVLSRDPKTVKLGSFIHKGSNNALDVGPGGSATYLEYAGTALLASQAYVTENRQRILDLCQAVAPDPEKISGSAQSAKSIEFLYAPMLEAADVRRQQFGEAIERQASLTLRIARHALANPPSPSARVIFDLPDKIVMVDPDPTNPEIKPVQTLTKHSPGQGGVPEVSWGPYFADTPLDVQTKVATLTNAYTGGVLDLETVTREMAALYDISDSDALLRRILEEQRAKQANLIGSFTTGFTSVEGEGQVAPEEGSILLGSEGQGTGEEAKLSDQALAGPQIKAVKELVAEVVDGIIPRESAIAILVHLYSLTPEAAEQVVGPPSFRLAKTDVTLQDGSSLPVE